MANIRIDTLSRDVRRKLKNAEYSEKEVDYIHKAIRERHLTKQVGFRRAAVILTAVFVIIMGLAVMSGPAMPAELIATMAGMMGAGMLIGLGAAWYAANKMTLQFLSALKQGYPELAEQYGNQSFKK